MEIEEFLKSKGLFYTRDLINIMDETINLPKIMEEYAKLYHESELKKLRVGDVSVSVCDFVWHNSDIVTNLKCRECGSSVSQY